MTTAFWGKTPSDLLVKTAKFILENGDEVGSRNGRVMEILNTQIEIEEPFRREILTEGRKANVFAQIAETMWVLSGRNDIEWLSAYLPRAKDFSDDGISWRGGYGPRIRGFRVGEDQLAHVIRLLRNDPLSRRAVISIYDRSIDMEDGKDIPCNDLLQFQSRLGKLYMTVTVRSNDLFWGWSGINAFEWSTLQEIVASLLGVEVGPLVFNIGSLHIYDRHWERAGRLSYEYVQHDAIRFNPTREVASLQDVDDLIEQWFVWENMARSGFVRVEMLDEFSDPLFRAWAAAIAYYWTRWSEWLDVLDGTALAAAIAKAPQSVLPEPVQRSHGLVDGVAPGRGLKERTRAFYDFVSDLHATKHESYGDSWKKRGEKMSILANIARKVDRLGVTDEYESEADTVIDLWVYLAKYLDWIEGGGSGPDKVNDLLHFGLCAVDDLPRDHGMDLRGVQQQINDYFSVMETNVVAKKSKIEFVERMMRQVLPIAVDLWEAENIVMDEANKEIDRIHGPGAAAALDKAFKDGTVFSDEYRGADVD